MSKNASDFERVIGRDSYPLHCVRLWIYHGEIVMGVDAAAHDAQIVLSSEEAQQLATYLVEAIESQQAACDE